MYPSLAAMRLYTYARSSASYRVRIALEWKGIEREDVAVNLREGAQLDAAYLALNPQGLVPFLVDGGLAIGQSLAILEYLEERRPEPPLLPADPAGRARVRQLALLVACDVHPLQNLRVLTHLDEAYGAGEEGRSRWFRHFVERGLLALERVLAASSATGRFCHGDSPTFADVCLVPQVYNARRRDCDLSRCPTLVRVDAECANLEAFARAAPEAQPDFTP